MTEDPVVVQLHRERLRRGLSQREVGELLGHSSYGSVYAWESGTVSPTLPNLRRWCEALGFELAAHPAGPTDSAQRCERAS